MTNYDIMTHLSQKRSVWTLFFGALAVRVFAAVVNITYAAPDEYWQAPEIAHKLVYGVGYVTWEWWPCFELRGALHPFLLAAFHIVCKPLVALFPHITHHEIIAFIPRIPHALLAAISDVAVYKLAWLCNPRSAGLAYALNLTSWFLFYGASRTFSNGIEASLLAIGLTSWYGSTFGPLGGSSTVANGRAALSRLRSSGWTGRAFAGFIAAIAVFIRPTSVIPWIIVAAMFLYRQGFMKTVAIGFRDVLPGLVAGAAIGLACDYQLYGRFTSTLASFVQFNVMQGLDKLYGTYAPWWYLVDGVPVTTLMWLPLVLIGFWYPAGNSILQDIKIISLCYIGALSASSHKEHRFMLPALQLLHIVGAGGLASLSCDKEEPPLEDSHTESTTSVIKPQVASSRTSRKRHVHSSAEIQTSPQDAVKSTWAPPQKPSRLLTILPAYLAVSVAIHAALAMYFCRWHQAGAITAVKSLADQAARTQMVYFHHRGEDLREQTGEHSTSFPLASLMSIHFLMPCHSTPYYSVMHAPVSMLQFDCSAPSRDAYHAAGASNPSHTGPGIPTESMAWEQSRDKMLYALYGDRAEPPAACDVAPSDVYFELHRSYDANTTMHFHLDPSHTAVCDEDHVNHYDDMTFAVHSAAFLEEFGPPNVRALSARLAHHRQLPTHIVMYDTDAQQESVQTFLTNNNFTIQSAHFYAAVKTDVHRVGADPSRVLVFVHTCWQSLAPAA